MGILVNTIHIITCVGLVTCVLLQSSKGGGLAGTFGGMGDSGSMFGGRGAATFLSKLTTGLAVLFMMMNIVQGFMVKSRMEAPKSLIQQEAERSPGSNLPVVPQASPTDQQTSPQPAEGSGESDQ